MSATIEKKFDYINLFYGMGAATILVAAMFKFLAWDYAETMFIIGLTVESIIFLISAFDWEYITPDYKWDNVFPQLIDGNSKQSVTPEMKLMEITIAQEKQMIVLLESLTVLQSSINTLNSATQKLSQSLEKIDSNYEVVSETTAEYQKELTELKSKVQAFRKTFPL